MAYDDASDRDTWFSDRVFRRKRIFEIQISILLIEVASFVSGIDNDNQVRFVDTNTDRNSEF